MNIKSFISDIRNELYVLSIFGLLSFLIFYYWFPELNGDSLSCGTRGGCGTLAGALASFFVMACVAALCSMAYKWKNKF